MPCSKDQAKEAYYLLRVCYDDLFLWKNEKTFSLIEAGTEETSRAVERRP